jgi:predicted O-methyltransferase YrrM
MNITNYIKTRLNILRYNISNIKRYSQILELILLHKPKSIIEIGVYKGLRSAQMLDAANVYSKNTKFYGFDLFENFYLEKEILEKELSKKPTSEQKVSKLLKQKGQINLFKGFTKTTLPIFVEKNLKVDFVFIDGGHSIETIENDWKYVSKLMHEKTIVVFDDFYHEDNELIREFGCNKIVLNLEDNYKVQYLSKVDRIPKNNLKIQLVKVTL